MMERAKLIGIVVVVLLTVIVVLQNIETVNTKILFLTLSMPRAALLFGTLGVGFIAGILVGNWLGIWRKK